MILSSVYAIFIDVKILFTQCVSQFQGSKDGGRQAFSGAEDFRNRFGTKGAELITQDMTRVARQFGFTKPDDVDMDTTAQEAGITHPTEMKLMGHLMKRLKKLHEEIKKTGQRKRWLTVCSRCLE